MLVNSKSVYLLRKKIASSYDSWEIDEAPMNTVHSDELNPSPEESQQFFDNVNDILEQKRLKGLRPPRIQFYIPSPFFYI